MFETAAVAPELPIATAGVGGVTSSTDFATANAVSCSVSMFSTTILLDSDPVSDEESSISGVIGFASAMLTAYIPSINWPLSEWMFADIGGS